MTRDEADRIARRVLLSAWEAGVKINQTALVPDFDYLAKTLLDRLGWGQDIPIGKRQAFAEVRPAISAFYDAVLDWTGTEDNPPEAVLEASRAIQRLTDPEREVPT